jgi:hypothetical protein
MGRAVVAQCHFHPDRPGAALCMRCREVICSECSTKVDGIHHCHACLKALAMRPARQRVRSAWWETAWVVVLIWGAMCGLLLLTRGSLAP